MKRLKSDIPLGAVEELVSEYKQEGALINYRTMECSFNGEVVGRRAYTQGGKLVLETPLKGGQKHGREYTWDEDGALLLVEPYVEGKIHGLAKQYGRSGKIIGTYRLVHGTGFDIWRRECGDRRVFISEIHSLRDGLPHGYEWWWFDWEHRSIWIERHSYEGKYHGIEREWNSRGRLSRGHPKYWIAGQAISKRKYLKVARTDKTLPPFREKDNGPRRKFLPEIERLVSHHSP